MAANECRALAWSHGVVTLEALGGMIGPTLFVLPGGQQVTPFQVAPWAGEPGSEELPGILQRLRGEWPCVPFGSDADRAAVGDWPSSSAVPTLDASPHGHGSNHAWRFLAAAPGRIGLAIDYPEAHPIRRLVRTVTPDPAAAALDFELRIEVRDDCRLPIGLHPTFRLPTQPRGARLEIADGIVGRTFPVAVDESAVFEQDRLLSPWHDVPLRDGGSLDIRQLPLPRATEELVQLLDMPGTAALVNEAEGYRVGLRWNAEHFPSMLLWMSNRGRRFAPWNGRHLALGMEPICSAFDLGPQISAADNPIARAGVPTSRAFVAGESFVTRYRIEVEPLA